MDHIFTYYSVFFLVTSLMSFFVAFLAWQRKSVKSARELSLLMLVSGLWALINSAESGVYSQSGKIFWSQIEYFTSATVPIIYLIFVSRFTGYVKYINRKSIPLLFIIPLITIILVLTSKYHNLIWTGFSEISAVTNLMEYYHGIWFWTGYLGYNYIVFVVATIFIIGFIFRHTKTFRLQGVLIFIAGLGPWMASILYVSDNSPFPGLNIAPASISLSGLLFLISILYIRFLDLVPVARETLVETLKDGILAIDNQNRIQDINKAAISILGIPQKNILGMSIDIIESKNEILLKTIIRNDSYESMEISIQKHDKTYQIINQKLKEQSGSRLVIIRDITDQKNQQTELLRQDKLLMAVSKASHVLLSEKSIEKAMQKALEKIGIASEQDRVYIFENFEDKKNGEIFINQRFEWKSEGIGVLINNPELQNLSMEKISTRWYKILKKGEVISGNLSDFNENEQIFLASKNISSILLVPIMFDTGFWGFVGFDKSNEFYEWKPAEKVILTTFAASLGTAIERNRSQDELKKQSHLRQLLTEISSNYINIPLQNVDAEMKNSLSKLRRFVGADRSYIFDFDQSTNNCSNTFESCSSGIKPRISKLQNYPLGVDFVDAFRSGKIMYIANVQALPDVNAKEVLDPQGIKSFLAIPMIHNQECIGFLGFDWILDYHDFSETEQQILHVYAQMLVNVKLRKEGEEKLISAKEKAEESNRLKTAFINNISHEIRTPLNGILSFGQFMADPDLTNEQRQSYLKILDQASSRLVGTIDDYTDIAMIASGTMEVIEAPFKLSHLDSTIAFLFKTKANEKHIDFHVELDKKDSQIEIFTDEKLLIKVFNILIDNAVKFTEKGKIYIGSNVKSESIEFYVQDTGKGIHPEQLDAIFDYFTQEDYSMTRDYEGSGLGLSIAKGIVKLLGGKIWVQSKIQEGSTFYFSIPCENNLTNEIIEDDIIKDQKIISKSILVAEDDESNFYYLEVILKKLGCNYIHAVNGTEAVEYCKQNPDISLVLMDIKMPIMNGLDATRKIKEFRPTLPIIALTAFAQSGDEQRIIEAGCDMYYAKPIMPKVLTELIQEKMIL